MKEHFEVYWWFSESNKNYASSSSLLTKEQKYQPKIIFDFFEFWKLEKKSSKQEKRVQINASKSIIKMLLT